MLATYSIEYTVSSSTATAGTTYTSMAGSSFTSTMSTQLQTNLASVAGVSASGNSVASNTVDPNLSNTMSYPWIITSDYSEHPLVLCQQGDSIRFHWD